MEEDMTIIESPRARQETFILYVKVAESMNHEQKTHFRWVTHIKIWHPQYYVGILNLDIKQKLVNKLVEDARTTSQWLSIIITVHTKMIHFAFQKLISMSYDVLT